MKLIYLFIFILTISSCSILNANQSNKQNEKVKYVEATKLENLKSDLHKRIDSLKIFVQNNQLNTIKKVSNNNSTNWASIVIPILAVILGSVATFLATIYTQKRQFRLDNKISAYKSLLITLNKFKGHCLGSVAYHMGHDTAQYNTESTSALTCRTALQSSLDENFGFISNEIKSSIQSLINDIGNLTNVELNIQESVDDGIDIINLFEVYEQRVSLIIKIIIDEIN